MSCMDLKQALEHLGEKVSDQHIFRMIAECDPNNTGQMSFYQFKTLVQNKREDERGSSEDELL